MTQKQALNVIFASIITKRIYLASAIPGFFKIRPNIKDFSHDLICTFR